MNLLTLFHEDWTINVASRPYKEKCPALGGHVFKATKVIFELIQDIIGTNLLTNFHDYQQLNVTSRVITSFYYSHIRKNTPPRWWPCFSTNWHHFWISSKILLGFYYSHIRKNAPPLGSHVFQPNRTIFELIQDINKTNLLTIFHEDWTKNVTSRVLTRFYKIHIKTYMTNAPPPGGHAFKATKTIFELVQDNIGTNLLTKFHDDQKLNVASRVLTRKNAPPPGGHVFKSTSIIFKLVKDIIGMNLLIKFHEGRTINVKNAPPLCIHVFQAKSHEDLKIKVASRVLTRKNAPPPGGHVFQPTGIIFELVQDIIGINLLTKFHEDWTKMWSQEKNAPPLGSHVFQANVTIFELIQDIIETNLLTKFQEDWTINVASRELTRQI
ncbi:hypothetical protein DPMN_107755 [Dreissena polymorpha]|uniref:Uncharacterized protein n=1 Tax=Dreissena polymorpha TaxID=45954 RepID=A0A9D4K7J7_DREPO|nr:hypothetical protein DPMN_107755 [Dreissena polymorpha]